jgi:hypothetical protein
MTLDSRVAFSSRRMFASWPLVFVLDESTKAIVSASSSFFLSNSRVVFCFVVHAIGMQIREITIHPTQRPLSPSPREHCVFDNCFSSTCPNSQAKRYQPSRQFLRPSRSRRATGPWRRLCPPQALQRLSLPQQAPIDFASSRLRP